MWSYAARLERDLTRWQEKGWIGGEGASAIRAELAARPGGPGLAGVLAVLGALLLVAGVLSFVAANWPLMPRLVRLGLLGGSLWLAYGLALGLLARGQRAFAEAAILTGIGIYGASIMLIGQMYHLGGNPADAVLAWTAGALLAAALLRSTAALLAAIGLAALWSGLETLETGSPHWAYLPAWLLLAATVPVVGSRRILAHLLALSLAGWVVVLGYVLRDGHEHLVVTLIGLATLAAGLAAGRRAGRLGSIARAMPAYGLGIAFAGLSAMQFLDGAGDPGVPWLAANGLPLAPLAAFTLALIVASLWLGLLQESRALVWLAYACFCVEVFALYLRTVGSLLDTALFFLVAGVLLCLLAVLAWRLHRRVDGAGGGAAPESLEGSST